MPLTSRSVMTEVPPTAAAAARTIPSITGIAEIRRDGTGVPPVVRRWAGSRAQRHRERPRSPGNADGFDLGVHAQLGQDILDVALDREDADRQGLSNLLCRASIGEQRENLTLSPGQGIDLVGATLAELRDADEIHQGGEMRRGKDQFAGTARRIVSGTVRPSPVLAMSPTRPRRSPRLPPLDRLHRSPQGRGPPRVALRDLSDNVDGWPAQLDREDVDGDFRRRPLRLSRVANRPEHGNALVSTRERKVVREPKAPLHHQDSNVDVHLHRKHRHEAFAI